MPSRSMEETPQEGLLAALSRVAPDRFPCVAIVDDSRMQDDSFDGSCNRRETLLSMKPKVVNSLKPG